MEDKSQQLKLKLKDANLASHTVTAHKKANEGILLCRQLERTAALMKKEFIKIKVKRPVEIRNFEHE
jgi:hypothetical protein